MEDVKQVPALYILLRTDMASMNAGKGAAQASHASNAFVHFCHFTDVGEDSEQIRRENECNIWARETSQGFGTSIVLGVDERQMRAAVEVSQRAGFIANIVHDPSYPIRDGDITHLLPIDTCAYVFVQDMKDPIAKALLGNFPLHP